MPAAVTPTLKSCVRGWVELGGKPGKRQALQDEQNPQGMKREAKEDLLIQVLILILV